MIGFSRRSSLRDTVPIVMVSKVVSAANAAEIARDEPLRELYSAFEAAMDFRKVLANGDTDALIASLHHKIADLSDGALNS